jgi:hypothetical protein
MNELKISGAQLETLEHYVDRQREIGAQIFFCAQASYKATAYNEIAIGGDPVPISDDTRPLLLEFLTATKLELERQARGMELVVRIGMEEEEEEKDDEWDAMAVL